MKIINLFILTLLISFGSIGAVCYTPGLPGLAHYFLINEQVAGQTVTWYLVGYAFGQLLYGPLASRFGGKAAINMGAVLAIIGSLGCILSYYVNSFSLLLISRCIMALGAASGLKMTLTISSKLFNQEESARAMGLLTMAFAITPGLGVLLGGILVEHFNWTAPFYLMIVYSLLIIYLVQFLPEVYASKDLKALKISKITSNYLLQFQDCKVVSAGLLVGFGTCIVYIFAAVSPFISMKIMSLTPAGYGIYNFIPSIGILIGAITSNQLGKKMSPFASLRFGLIVSITGIIILGLCLSYKIMPISLFIPMIIVYFGMSFIFGNSSAIALHRSTDKGNVSAVISFINMGSAFLLVTLISCIDFSYALILPGIYLGLSFLAIIWYRLLK